MSAKKTSLEDLKDVHYVDIASASECERLAKAKCLTREWSCDQAMAKQKMRMHAQCEKALHAASATSFDDLRCIETYSAMKSL